MSTYGGLGSVLESRQGSVLWFSWRPSGTKLGPRCDRFVSNAEHGQTVGNARESRLRSNSSTGCHIVGEQSIVRAGGRMVVDSSTITT
jgi:hypothetical protein